jgi:hypothetical protein
VTLNGREVRPANDRDILMAVAAIQASCQHVPEVWQRACLDDPRDGKRYHVNIIRCHKCGLFNPPADRAMMLDESR